MNTESIEIRVSGLAVRIVRKDIKNLHLGVYPPNGRVRVAAAPLSVSDGAVRLAVISKMGWIKKRQARFAAQSRQTELEMVSGESHYFQGRRYRLCIVEHHGPEAVCLPNNTTLELRVRPETGRDKREAVLNQWYRGELCKQIPALIEKWEPETGVEVSEWGIKKMKTRWGTCNSDVRRIWLNLELAKKPALCLEYVLVHEMAHLLECHHNERFRGLMDRFMPLWRLYRDRLNQSPLAHEEWEY